MRAMLFCFSGTGNTRWVCDQFVAEGQRRGWVETCLVAVDRNTIADLEALGPEAYDLIGLAHPIYGADLPPLVRKLIGAIEARLTHPANAFVIATFGFVNGLGWWAERKIFRNLRVNQYINVRMPNNITTPKLESPVPGPAETAAMQARALLVVRRAWDRILQGRRWITGFGPWLVAGLFIRRATAQGIATFYRQLSVDPGRCTLCRDCVNHCPAGAISLSEKNFAFSSSCTACTRCYNACPENAILLEGTYADPKRYPRHYLQ